MADPIPISPFSSPVTPVTQKVDTLVANLSMPGIIGSVATVSVHCGIERLINNSYLRQAVCKTGWAGLSPLPEIQSVLCCKLVGPVSVHCGVERLINNLNLRQAVCKTGWTGLSPPPETQSVWCRKLKQPHKNKYSSPSPNINKKQLRFQYCQNYQLNCSFLPHGCSAMNIILTSHPWHVGLDLGDSARCRE